MKNHKEIKLKVISPDYEKAETDLLKAALKRSYTERFHIMTTLMKRSLMFRKAKIKHQPFPASE